jgi:hypothetical protein
VHREQHPVGVVGLAQLAVDGGADRDGVGAEASPVRMTDPSWPKPGKLLASDGVPDQRMTSRAVTSFAAA